MFKQEDIIVRFAQASDAEVLGALTYTAFGGLDIQWKDATKDWIIAEIDGTVQACLQLYMGRPVGKLEHLCVNKDLDQRAKYAIMLELIKGGLLALQQTGSQLITVFVDFQNKGMKRMLKRRFGARVTNSGNLLTAYLGV